MNHRPLRHTSRTPLLLSQCLLALLVSALIAGSRITAAPGSSSAVPTNPDDKTIVHVLNRLGFGAAPGDVERVRRMGLDKYIDQQLRPEAIPDEGMTARLAGLDTLTLNSHELAEDYFMPAQMAQRRAKQEAASQSPGSATDKRE